MGGPKAAVWEGIVDDTPLQNFSSLTHNRVYSRIGQNVCLAAKPAVVHFGGFQLGQVHSQTLKVYNTSASSTRLHIIVPTTPYFKATCEQKKGLLAPGMCEIIQIEFCPKEWRYYYDCVRIHCQDENLLIPLHAYPIMNETKFPSRIDFGKCALGETSTRHVMMECKVPIDFEFEIVPMKTNPLYVVFPTSGVVPANGSVEITIEFCPTRLATEVLELEVRLAEFHSAPVRCRVSGSGFPGVARQRGVRSLTGAENPDVEELEGTKPLGQRSFGATLGAGGGDGKGGSGGGDAFTRLLTEKRMNASRSQPGSPPKPINVRLPVPRPVTPEQKVDGIYVPPDIVTPADLTYVLNQEPGKLRSKDIKGAIVQRKQELEAAERQLGATRRATRPPGLDVLDDMSLEPSVKAEVFAVTLKQVEEHKRRMAMTSVSAVGEDLMLPEDVQQAQQARRDSLAEHTRRVQLQDAQRLEPELVAGGARYVPAEHASASAAGPAASADSTGASSATSTSAGVAAGSSEQEAAELDAFQPTWDLNKKDVWLKRQQVLYRFVQAGRRIVYQLRARKRLQRINAFLDGLGRDPHRIAAEVISGTKRVASGSRQGRPSTAEAEAALNNPANVRLHPLPVYREAAFNSYQAVEPREIADFDDLTPMQLQVPLQYKLLGYQPEDFPAFTPYMPPLPDQPLLSGAEEESIGPRAIGPAVGDIAEFGAMPQAFLQRPFDTLPLGSRYTDAGVFVPLRPSWGMDKAAAIQPRILSHPDSTQTEDPGTNSLKALAGIPLLSDLYTPARHPPAIGETIQAPPLMTGPDPEDLLEADPSQPLPAVEVSTKEALEQAFPGSTSQAAPTGPDGKRIMPKQQKQAELDARLAGLRAARAEAYQQRVDKYNSSVKLKSRHALRD